MKNRIDTIGKAVFAITLAFLLISAITPYSWGETQCWNVFPDSCEEVRVDSSFLVFAFHVTSYEHTNDPIYIHPFLLLLCVLFGISYVFWSKWRDVE